MKVSMNGPGKNRNLSYEIQANCQPKVKYS